MDREREQSANLPIACTLTPDELASRRAGLLPGLLSKAAGTESVAGGFRWRFESQPGLLTQVAAIIDAEHHCCRFLRFVLTVDPGDRPVWLEVTGPEGTAEFLTSLVDTTSSE